jgi:hypothetical protein
MQTPEMENTIVQRHSIILQLDEINEENRTTFLLVYALICLNERKYGYHAMQ